MTERATLQTFIYALEETGDQLCLLSIQRHERARWTYAELGQTIRHLAHGLIQAGIGRGDCVALLAASSPEWVISCLAVIGAGAAVIPLDTQIRPATLEQILHDSGARYIFTTADYVKQLPGLGTDSAAQVILLDAPPDDPRSWQAMLQASSAPLPTIAPDDQAALFYTSGTTGIPKGVPLTHRNLVFQLESVLATRLIAPHERVVMPLPMYHIYPFTIGILVPLAFRATLVLPQSIAGAHILRAIQEGQASVIIGVPRLYRALVSRIETQVQARGPLFQQFFQRSLALSIWLRRRWNIHVGRLLFRSLHQQFGPHLRLLTSGGSSLDPDLAYKLEGIGWRLAIGYGLTETAPLLTFNLPGDGDPKLASVGQPLPGIDIRIEPSGDGEVYSRTMASAGQSPAEEGEIVARGPSVFTGYRNLPEQTARAFTDDGWFRTGDMGYFDADGYLYISGRVSTLIVTEGGKNVQPEPVEEIYQQHQFIQEIGILQDKNRLVALIVPAVDEIERLDNGDIAQAVREAVSVQSKQLSSYQRITHYALTSEALPRTNLGKIQRHRLLERYLHLQQNGQ